MVLILGTTPLQETCFSEATGELLVQVEKATDGRECLFQFRYSAIPKEEAFYGKKEGSRKNHNEVWLTSLPKVI